MTKKNDEKSPPSLSSAGKAYYKKYVASGAWRPGSEEAIFLTFFENLNVSEWFDLITDILQEEPEIWDIFRPQPGEDLLAYSAMFINRLGNATQRLIRQAIGRHLSLSISRKHRTEVGVFKVLSFCRLLPEPCDAATLATIVKDDKIGHDVRLMAAQVLANQPRSLPAEFWQCIDIDEIPDLLPVVVSALIYYSPAVAISVLGRPRKAPREKDTLEYPLRMALRQLIGTEQGRAEISAATGRFPSWARSILGRVLGLAEFDYVRSELTVNRDLRQLPASIEVQEYLAGKIDLETIEPKEGLADAIHEALAKWRPLWAGGQRRSERLIQLVRRLPSPGLLRGALAAFEEILLNACEREGLTKAKSKISKGILEFLAENPLMIVMDSSTDYTQRQSLLSYFGRPLQLALKFKELAHEAYRQLVEQVREQSALVVITRAALREANLTPEDCERCLRRHMDPEVAAEILRATLIDGETASEKIDSEERIAIGAKLYEHNPAFIFGSYSEVDKAEGVVMQDSAVVLTFGELALSYTRGITI